VRADERSFRIALVADEYVNPPPGGVDAVAAAAQTGWGVMALPPGDYPPEVTAPLLAEVAEQAQEFARHGYRLVLIGSCPGLAEALARAGVAVADQASPASLGQAVDFLAAQPEPAARWDPAQLPR